MVLNKKDFIEMEFTGRVKDGEVFDSNIKKDLEKADLKLEPKPFIFSLGEGMFLQGIDDFLIGKDVGKYNIELSPEKAFGIRDQKLIKIITINAFRKHELNPVPGMMFNLDGRVAKVLSVSGGRVSIDFNNPLAGKIVTYNINVMRKVEDINEKVKAFVSFLFRRDLKFQIKDKKITIEVEKGMGKVVEIFKDKFKELLSLELEAKEVEPVKDSMLKNIEEKSQ